MSRVKQQHTVPRLYLRRFTDSNERIHVFDKMEMRSFVTNVQNVAAERAFLDLPSLESIGISKQFMETDYLQAFDDEAAHALRGLLSQLESGTFRRIRGRRRKELARFIAVQSLRTGKHREETIESFGLTQEIRVRAYLQGAAPDLADKPFRIRPAAEAVPLLHALSLLNLPLIGQLTSALLSHIWQVFQAPADSAFWTSDNPVIRHGHIKDPLRAMNGFASRGIEVALPVSSAFLLSLVDAHEFHFIEPRRGELSPAAADNVIYYNSLQVIQSTRFVFASSSEFGLAEELCSKRPHLRDPKRPRIAVSGGSWSNPGGVSQG